MAVEQTNPGDGRRARTVSEEATGVEPERAPAPPVPAANGRFRDGANTLPMRRPSRLPDLSAVRQGAGTAPDGGAPDGAGTEPTPVAAARRPDHSEPAAAPTAAASGLEGRRSDAGTAGSGLGSPAGSSPAGTAGSGLGSPAGSSAAGTNSEVPTVRKPVPAAPPAPPAGSAAHRCPQGRPRPPTAAMRTLRPPRSRSVRPARRWCAAPRHARRQ